MTNIPPFDLAIFGETKPIVRRATIISAVIIALPNRKL